MKRFLAHFPDFALLGLLFLSTSFSAAAHADTLDQAIASRTTEVAGAKLHYLTAGHGASHRAGSAWHWKLRDSRRRP